MSAVTSGRLGEPSLPKEEKCERNRTNSLSNPSVFWILSSGFWILDSVFSGGSNDTIRYHVPQAVAAGRALSVAERTPHA